MTKLPDQTQNALRVADFRENLVSFKTHRMRSAECVWINHEALEESAGSTERYRSKEKFLEEFAYGISGSERFVEIDFDVDDEKIFKAERYGGRGVGVNGGGARCGTNGAFQVKGIGRNCVAGADAKKWYSYGSLNLIDAAYEVILSQVLGCVLPVGTADVYGLIATGENAAYISCADDDEDNAERGWGGLLVRESCLRPAHFLRAPDYSPVEEYRNKIMADVYRVRAVNKALRRNFDNDNQFIRFLGAFLANCSSQFAFARAARLTHGSVSSSNLCMDGRWLDLSNASFLTGGKNYGGQQPFYQDYRIVVEVINELVYTYAKYNALNLNIDPLINYYFEQFEAYFSYYGSWVLGLDHDSIPEWVRNDAYKRVVQSLARTICSDSRVIVEWPGELDPEDPVIGFIEGLMLSLTNERSGLEKLTPIADKAGFHPGDTLSAFQSVIEGVFSGRENWSADYRSFVVTMALRSLKRAIFSAFYYKAGIESNIKSLCMLNRIDSLSEYICDCIDASGWIYESVSSGTVTIFNSDAVDVRFDCKAGEYSISSTENGGIDIFRNFSDVLLALRTLNHKLFNIGNSDFVQYLVRMGGTICRLEKEMQ